MKAYSARRHVVVLICCLISVFAFGCKPASNKESELKPVNAGLLQPISKLKERHVLVRDSLRYVVAYHNAFLKSALPLTIESINIDEADELSLSIRQGENKLSFRERLLNKSPEEVLAGILATLVHDDPESTTGDIGKFRDIDSLLSTGDEFSCVKALNLIDSRLKGCGSPSAQLLSRAANAYLYLNLLIRRGNISSLPNDLLARGLALNGLSNALAGGDGIVYNRAMLRYLCGDIKGAYELAVSTAGEKDPRCRVFVMLKDPRATLDGADSPDLLCLRFMLTSSAEQGQRRKIIESLYAREPENLFVLSGFGSLGVDEGRTFTPLLVGETIDRHLGIMRESYQEWIRNVPGGEKLLAQKGAIESAKEQFLAYAENQRFLSKIFHRKDEIVPYYDRLERIYETLFQGVRYPTEISAVLFSGEDERFLFYHDLLTALGEWHSMVTDSWGVPEYSLSGALKLGRLFGGDPAIRYLYGRALLANDRRNDAYATYRDILDRTGDADLVLRILNEQEFVRANNALSRELIEQVYHQSPQNGRLCNYLGKVCLFVDPELRIKYLREGILKEPWNIEAVYGLSWDTNDFSPMAGLLRELPESAEAYYYAGFLSYNRMGNIQQGIELMKKTLTINPAYVDAVTELGIFLEAGGDYAKAIEVYRDYLKVDLESLGAVEVEGRIGGILLKQGETSEAVKIYSRLAETYKESAIHGAVFSYLAAGDNVNSELWAQRYVERYPHPNAYSALCKVYYRTGDLDKLMKTMQEYSRQFPNYSMGIVSGWQSRISRKDLFAKNLGVLIYKVLSNGQAEKVGLVDGDIILSYGGKPLDSGYEFVMYRYPLGKKETLTVVRKGALLTFEVSRGLLGIEYEY